MSRSLLLCAGIALACRVPAQSPGLAPRPTLVLVLTVDQLRPDYLEQFGPQLTGGLARLVKGGAVFMNGFQDHAITETAPGHASILSGRFPRSTGIVGNTAGVLDPEMPLIGARGDPASPFRFRGTTLADWLRYENPRARVLSISRKDRAAILPLGRAKGEAYWYASNGMFTTSRYYADTLPTWIQQFNARRFPRSFAGAQWDLLLPTSQYKEPDSVAVESGGSDNTFPHLFPRDSQLVTAVLANYPMMDEVTLKLALAAINARELGAVPNRTDLLAISLSTTDAVGHKYGPDSREVHDQVLRLDRYLGAFFDSLYQLRDSTRIVVVLTADHGVAPYPNEGFTTRFRSTPGGYVDLQPIAARLYRDVVAAGVDSSAFRWEWETLYLEPNAFAAAKVNRDSVARLFVGAAARVPGVERAELWRDVLAREENADPITRRWRHMFPADVPVAAVITVKPYWYWAGVSMATHGTPHDYDARVPIIFAGAGIRPGMHSDVVRVVDIAPTLAAILRVRPMEALDGTPIRVAIR